jgi:hypothetical protein
MNKRNNIYLSIIFIFILVTYLGAIDLSLPDQVEDKWLLQKPVRIFKGDQLFSHINGGAELFLEYGFYDLAVYKYVNEDISIEIELYRMETATSALGIYLSKTGQQLPLKELSVRNSANQYQIVFTTGQYFVMINNFSGQTKQLRMMIELSQSIIQQVHVSDADNIFSYLPRKNMIEDSQVIFRGPFGLQSIYTFGKGDILLLKGKIFGVGARYDTETDHQISKLFIPYPNASMAKEAYENLISNLDPYLELLEKNSDYFIFKDYKQKYGKVIITESLIKIDIHLNSINYHK